MLNKKTRNELRKDIVSGDWIIFSPERRVRPHDLAHKFLKRKVTPIAQCVFEHLKVSGNWPPLFAFPDEKDWKLVLIPNKFPILGHEGKCGETLKAGMYEYKDGIGFHELIVGRDHKKNFAHITPSLAEKIFELIGERYRIFKKDGCVWYASTFFNWGPTAGASLYHPHYQLLGIPVIPPPVAHSIAGSDRYFTEHHRCVHCDILAYEGKEKDRILFEDDHAVALAPFASQSPYEVRIYPKKHNPFFEIEEYDILAGVARMLQRVLLRMETRLHDPDLNFFIHTSPLKDQSSYKHYHWHIEVLPRISVFGGLEYGTGVNVNTVLPEEAARILR